MENMNAPGSYSAIYPPHTLFSRYWYNTLNQVTKQLTPDADTTRFWYDRLGRLVVSRNAKQNDNNTYSYTIYDQLGRIIEVGQKSNPHPMLDDTSRNDIALNKWIKYGANSTRTELTHTYYDVAALPVTGHFGTAGQTYLRSRVASVSTEDIYDADSLTYTNATHYSYDVAGNVKTVIQEIGDLRSKGQAFKKIDYSYDLVSGKVNKVYYQKDSLDKFIHWYLYDQDNRLQTAYTTNNGLLWQREANYLYYKHGPLGRVEIGQRQVQGVDYAYTLQGWLKGVNSDLLKNSRDIGKDGLSSSHALFGKDAYGFTLSYFDLDYKPIGTNNFETIASTSGGFGASSLSLYNGNIRRAVYALKGLTDSTLGYSYHYDQLNRLISTGAWNNYSATTFTWNTSGSALSKWKEQVIYDPNGNILTYQRTGSSPVKMDSLIYRYTTGKNRLTYVDDGVNSSNYTTDIDDQSSGNYTYDATGNLVSDAQEQISLIKWTVAGKVDSIARSGGSTKDKLKFYYDATGNRVGKVVYSNSGQATKTWYVRDAQGNIMATYALTKTSGLDTLKWKEQEIYGSSRLGLWQPNMRLYPSQFSLPGDTFHFTTKAGDKRYELINHLGNVMGVVTDRKIGIGSNNSAASYYLPDIASIQDYYPFGATMPGRSYNNGNYRFGFSGMEQDNEVKGTGNSLDFGARIYDPRLGRWLKVDPKAAVYPGISPYTFSLNTPIQAKDPDGELVIFINGLPAFGACCPGTFAYWGSWANSAMNAIGDHNSMFVDGSNTWLSLTFNRYDRGYTLGMQHAADVISNLKTDENGKIIESVKFVTHSQGAATQRGFSQALTDYVNVFNTAVDASNAAELLKQNEAAANGESYTPNLQKRIEGFQIESTVDISAFQGHLLEADENSKENYYMRNDDGSLFNFPGAWSQKISGSKEIGLDKNGNPKAKEHHPSFFDANDLPKDKDNVDVTNTMEYGDE